MAAMTGAAWAGVGGVVGCGVPTLALATNEASSPQSGPGPAASAVVPEAETTSCPPPPEFVRWAVADQSAGRPVALIAPVRFKSAGSKSISKLRLRSPPALLRWIDKLVVRAVPSALTSTL